MTSFWNQLIIEKYIKLPCKLEDPMAQVVSTLPVSGRWHALLNERGPANTFAIRLPIWLEDCRESPHPKSIEALTACREIAFDKYGKGRIVRLSLVKLFEESRENLLPNFSMQR